MEFLGVALIILAVLFYFLPALIADRRKAGQSTAIGWVNLLFGWTILGWIAALVWAVSDAPKVETLPPDTSLRDCPACYSKIDPRATICPHCRSTVEFIPHESGRLMGG